MSFINIGHPKANPKMVNWAPCDRGFLAPISQDYWFDFGSCTEGDGADNAVVVFQKPDTAWVTKDKTKKGIIAEITDWKGTIDGIEYTLTWSGWRRRYWPIGTSDSYSAQDIWWCGRVFLSFGGNIHGAALRKDSDDQIWCYITVQTKSDIGSKGFGSGDLSVWKHLWVKDTTGGGWQQVGDTKSIKTITGAPYLGCEDDCGDIFDCQGYPHTTPAFWSEDGTKFTCVVMPAYISNDCRNAYKAYLIQGTVGETSYSVSSGSLSGMTVQTRNNISSSGDACLCSGAVPLGTCAGNGTFLRSGSSEGWSSAGIIAVSYTNGENYVASDYDGNTLKTAKIVKSEDVGGVISQTGSRTFTRQDVSPCGVGLSVQRDLLSKSSTTTKGNYLVGVGSIPLEVATGGYTASYTFERLQSCNGTSENWETTSLTNQFDDSSTGSSVSLQTVGYYDLRHGGSAFWTEFYSTASRSRSMDFTSGSMDDNLAGSYSRITGYRLKSTVAGSAGPSSSDYENSNDTATSPSGTEPGGSIPYITEIGDTFLGIADRGLICSNFNSDTNRQEYGESGYPGEGTGNRGLNSYVRVNHNGDYWYYTRNITSAFAGLGRPWANADPQSYVSLNGELNSNTAIWDTITGSSWFTFGDPADDWWKWYDCAEADQDGLFFDVRIV